MKFPWHFLIVLMLCGVSRLPGTDRDLSYLRFEALTDRFENAGGEIHCIVEGPSGFIWFGTNRGALRYDGYSVEDYRNVAGDPKSLINDVIWSFLVDARRRFWIGTQMGVSRYVPEIDGFENYILNPIDLNNNLNNRCNAIVEDSQGNIYASAESGIVYRFDEESNDFVPLNVAGFGVIKSMACDALDRIWIGSNESLYLYDPVSKTTKDYSAAFELRAAGSRNFLYSLHVGNPRKVWAATAYQGIVILDLETEEVRRLPVRNDNEARVHYLMAEKDGRVWSCHGAGLTLYDQEGERLYDYHASSSVDSLPYGSIRCIAIDGQENLWLGSWKHGVHVSTNNKLFKRNYLEKSKRPVGLTPVVSKLMWDDRGRLWVGYSSGGIDVYESNASLAFALRHNPRDERSIGQGSVYSMYQDSRGDIWVGTYHGGLMLFDEANRSFQAFAHQPDDPYSIPGGDPRNIAEDERGRLWMALKGAGIAMYDPADGRFYGYRSDPYNTERSLLDDWPSDILCHPNGKVYVATPIGLSALDVESGRFENYTPVAGDSASLSNASCHSLLLDSEGQIWVGTGNGANRFDPVSKTFMVYSMEDGMPSHQALCMVEDRAGHVWVGTDAGLGRIDPRGGVVKSYDFQDGLMANAFYRNAAGLAPNGDVYFGQAGGLTYFDPDRIVDNENPPKVLITDIKVFFKSLEVAPGKEGSLQRHISELHELTLDYDQKVVTINFVAQNYIQPEKNEYAYMLEGFDPAWNFVGTRREANYTNLNPGVYTFRVKASNNDGVWNESGALLRLRILPPFWMRSWFYLGLCLLVVLLVYLYIKYRERSLVQTQLALEEEVRNRTQKINEQNAALALQKDELEQHREHLEQMVEDRTSELVKAKERAEEADRLKSSFLANLSHEIRTPLNAVVGFSTLLQQCEGDQEEICEYTELVVENSGTLLRLIDDLLDFSMIEANQITIVENEFAWDEFFERVWASQKILPRADGVELICRNEVGGLGYVMKADAHRIRQVLVNLLTNASKFTAAGRIVMSARIEGAEFCLSVEDTGKGIREEFLEAIFHRFYKLQEDEAQARRGVGLGLAISKRLVELMGGRLTVKSKYGEGSTFTARFPVSQLRRFHEEPHSEEMAAVLEPTRDSLPQECMDGRVLVIEDEECNFRVLSAMLKRTNLSVTWASCGETGLNVYRESGPYDLVLIDIKMPGIDGYETLARLREIDPKVPTVAQTAYARAEDKLRVLNAGFDFYLAKPIDQVELKRVVSSLLVD